eukprot:764886-Hanusia_phi.AAC.3
MRCDETQTGPPDRPVGGAGEQGGGGGVGDNRHHGSPMPRQRLDESQSRLAPELHAPVASSAADEVSAGDDAEDKPAVRGDTGDGRLAEGLTLEGSSMRLLADVTLAAVLLDPTVPDGPRTSSSFSPLVVLLLPRRHFTASFPLLLLLLLLAHFSQHELQHIAFLLPPALSRSLPFASHLRFPERAPVPQVERRTPHGCVLRAEEQQPVGGHREGEDVTDGGAADLAADVEALGGLRGVPDEQTVVGDGAEEPGAGLCQAESEDAAVLRARAVEELPSFDVVDADRSCLSSVAREGKLALHADGDDRRFASGVEDVDGIPRGCLHARTLGWSAHVALCPRLIHQRGFASCCLWADFRLPPNILTIAVFAGVSWGQRKVLGSLCVERHFARVGGRRRRRRNRVQAREEARPRVAAAARRTAFAVRFPHSATQALEPDDFLHVVEEADRLARRRHLLCLRSLERVIDLNLQPCERLLRSWTQPLVLPELSLACHAARAVKEVVHFDGKVRHDLDRPPRRVRHLEAQVIVRPRGQERILQAAGSPGETQGRGDVHGPVGAAWCAAGRSREDRNAAIGCPGHTGPVMTELLQHLVQFARRVLDRCVRLPLQHHRSQQHLPQRSDEDDVVLGHWDPVCPHVGEGL